MHTGWAVQSECGLDRFESLRDMIDLVHPVHDETQGAEHPDAGGRPWIARLFEENGDRAIRLKRRTRAQQDLGLRALDIQLHCIDVLRAGFGEQAVEGPDRNRNRFALRGIDERMAAEVPDLTVEDPLSIGAPATDIKRPDVVEPVQADVGRQRWQGT